MQCQETFRASLIGPRVLCRLPSSTSSRKLDFQTLSPARFSVHSTRRILTALRKLWSRTYKVGEKNWLRHEAAGSGVLPKSLGLVRWARSFGWVFGLGR